MSGRHSLFAVALSASVFALVACNDDNKGTQTTTTHPDTTGSETVSNSCKIDSDCTASITATACRAAKCNQTTKTCEAAPVTDGTSCTTNNPCKTGETCSAGTCAGGTAKPKDCGTKECGNDACGNSCGSCQNGETCTAGTCAAASGCGDITAQGCCLADGSVKFCNSNDEIEVIACKTEVPDFPNCGWTGSTDVGYDCSYEPAGSGTTEYPFLCPGETCPAGGCGDRECGSVCGQKCGSDCPGDKVCSPEGKCVDSKCGDITGAGCCTGDQATNKYCDNGRVLSINCPDQSQGAAPFCSWLTDKEYYDCGTSPDPDPATTDALPYLCAGETCTASCTGRECGTACGVSCGTCDTGKFCNDTGHCEVSPCGDLTYEGCCDGNVTYWCEKNAVKSDDCSTAANPDDHTCGWIPDDGTGGDFYYCGGSGADPSGKLKLDCADYTFEHPTTTETDPDAAAESGPEQAAEVAPEAAAEEAPVAETTATDEVTDTGSAQAE